MKKPTATLPSTKPDYLYSSQQSQSSLLCRPRNYQQQLSALLTALRSTHKFRYYMLFRDLQTVFLSSQFLLTDLLAVSSAEQLWRMLAVQGQEQLREQEQIGLLLRLLLELNTRKHAEADRGNIAAFDNFRAAIQWLIPQIVSFEAEIRMKLQEQLLQTCEKQKQRRQSEFRRYDQRMRQNFEAMEAVRKENLAERLKRETEAKNAQVMQKIQQDMHKIRASSQLRDAKETALLRKLAPYRWQKKRTYEDDTYRKDVQQTVQQDQSRRTRVIQQMKRMEKQKLRRAQATLMNTQNMYAETMRERLHLQLTSEGAALRNHEEQALRNLRHSVDVANNQRVSSLRKSLQGFSRHQDTLKIKQILQDHHNKVQFCNTIEDAVQPQSHVQKFESYYCTIHTDRALNKMDEVVDRHQRRLKKRINVILGGSEQRDHSSGRKSLVQLYDKSMNLVQQ